MTLRSVLGPLAVTALTIIAAGPAYVADPPEPAWVVSYLSRDISPWNADPALDSTACEWRIYDPVSGRDERFLTPPGTPKHVAWDAGFRAVEYQVGDRLMRCAWRLGARPVERSDRFPGARSHPLIALIDSMRIGVYAHRCLTGCDKDPGEVEQTVFMPLPPGDTLGLETGYTIGDSEHAMAPLVHVNARTGIRTTIYPKGAAGLFDQIGFGWRGRFLLAGAESEGSHWRVVDLGSGAIRRLGPEGSAAAVWVPAPAPGRQKGAAP